MRIRAVVLAVGALLASQLPFTVAAQGASSGTQPLVGTGAVVLVDSKGRFVFRALGAGSFTLTAQKSIELEAPSISLKGSDEITINGGKVAIN